MDIKPGSDHFTKLSFGGLLVALGIIYGDIGTSPLYTFQTIIRDGGSASNDLIFGGISCVFWTLTLQTTFKYILITLQADNKGEGGIFSLYALVKDYGKYLAYPAIIGAGTLLADGIITPPITITSAIEGLNGVKGLEHMIIPGNHLVMGVVIGILLLLFWFQRFGTDIVGKAFGPVMTLWFMMLGSLGLHMVIQHPTILAALNPYFGAKLLITNPRALWILGAVFLCTTGAEALYSDLGHCGRRNIRISWIFVKITLVLNYLGQGAWLLSQHRAMLPDGVNPFFEIVPHQFLLASIIIATMASIIASQALISGSFTLISEAISLGFWPRVSVKHPTNIHGQSYIPSINSILMIACIVVVFYFRTSEAMTAAYGFSITIAMLMTTILIYYFLRYVKKYPVVLVVITVCIFATVETSFFIANSLKLSKLLFFIIFEIGLIGIMYIMYNARRINMRNRRMENLKDYFPQFERLTNDKEVPLFASNVIYFTTAKEVYEVEDKAILSIFSGKPKRADTYWFVHVERTNEPYTLDYCVHELKKDKIIKVEFSLGFRIYPRLNLFFKRVIQDMIANGQLKVDVRYPVLNRGALGGEFMFVLFKQFLSKENEISGQNGFILKSYYAIQQLAESDENALGLDPIETCVEKVPVVISPVLNLPLKCTYFKVYEQ
jgi:KUP system potassium uptake protein